MLSGVLGERMRALRKIYLASWLAVAAVAAHAADLSLEGSRLVVSGMLDGSAAQAFLDLVRRANVQTVVFEDALGGTAEAAGLYAHAIRETGFPDDVPEHPFRRR